MGLAKGVRSRFSGGGVLEQWGDPLFHLANRTLKTTIIAQTMRKRRGRSRRRRGGGGGGGGGRRSSFLVLELDSVI